MLVELRKQRAPRGIREGGESAVERLVLILNHAVKYRKLHPPVNPGIDKTFRHRTQISAPFSRGPVTEEQVMGIQKTIKAMECTVEDTAIEAEGSGFEADDVICKDGQYDVYLDKEYNVVKKVKED